MLTSNRWTAAGGFVVLAAAVLTGAGPRTDAARPVPAATTATVDLPAVPATVACGDLVGHDLTAVPGAPTRLDSATVVPAGTGVPQPYCDVRGHTGTVHFELKLPTTGWTQRLLTVGCGGYCGVVSYPATTESDAGCPLVQSGELAVATTDLGHTANAFAADGIMWDGWADIGSSPFATLNYYDAVTRTLGVAKTDRFVKLYLPPGEYHCGGGPDPARADYLTPLMNWREQGAVPDKIVTTFTARTVPVYPFPNIAVYSGQGDPNDEANWRESRPQHNYPRHYDWLGNSHYTPAYQKWYTPGVTASSRP